MKSFEELQDFPDLKGRSLGKVERIRLRVVPDQIARSVGTQLQGIESFLGSNDAFPLECGSAGELGFELANYEEWPELVRVSTPTLGFRSLGTETLPGVYKRSGQKAVFVDFKTQRTPVAIVDNSGDGLLLWYESGVLQVGQILNLRGVYELGVSLNSDLKDWVKETHDKWLISEISQLCSLSTPMRATPMSHWIAMGIYLRYEEIQDPEDRADRVQKLLGGTLPDKEKRVREWVQALPESTFAALKRAVLNEIDVLREILLQIEDRFMTGDEIKESDVRALCRRRDEISGSQRLFSYAGTDVGRAQEWDSTLRRLDEIGEALMQDLRLDGLQFEEDEYLRRASFLRSSDWWTALVWPELEVDEI